MLVIVENSAAAGADFDLQSGLSETINIFLTKKARISSKFVVPLSELALLAEQEDDFSRLSPVEIGRKLDSGVVLYVQITNYNLYDADRRGYYSGSLVTRSILLDVSSGEVLWPESSTGRVVIAGFELETTGRAAAVERLVRTTAHCIVRNFYNCRKDRYKTNDEQTHYMSVDKW